MTLTSDRFVILSGCSGGGKSTLLAELAQRGFAVIEEPGRRIVREMLASGGAALPWVDPAAFLQRAIDLALQDRARAAGAGGRVFFDRSLVDAVSGLDALDGGDRLGALGTAHRYHPTVFLTPPWPAIHVADAERRHGLADAAAEYRRLQRDYPRLGYRTVIVPRIDVAARADFVLATLASPLACRGVRARQ